MTEILGIEISELDMKETIARINELLSGDSAGIIATVNPEFIIAARRDDEFRAILNHAEIATADGMGVVIAGLILKRRKLPRVTGADLSRQLLGGACPEARIFLLGGKEGIADQVRTKYLNSWIVGAESGGELNENDWELQDNDSVIDRINASRANTLLVAFGQVRQEKWINKNLSRMPNVRVAIGVGGTLDYLSGNVRRAPGFMRALGLEWLYRLAMEPKRWKRIWNATAVFGGLLIKELYGKRKESRT